MNLKKLERYLRVNLLGPGPRIIYIKKKNLPGRGLTKVEKHCCRAHLRISLWLINFPTGVATKMGKPTVYISVFWKM
jgi:hypothetical protein